MKNLQQTIASILTITKGDSFDFNSHVGKDIDNALRKEGFVTYQTGSRCKKASFESHLCKDNKRVEIIEANFMGKFTQIKVHIN